MKNQASISPPEERKANARREGIRKYLEEHGLPADGRAFRCITPDHLDAHPSMTFLPDSDRLLCRSPKCGSTAHEHGWDIFDIAHYLEGCESFSEQVRWVEDYTGIDLTGCFPAGSGASPTVTPQPQPQTQPRQRRTRSKAQLEADRAYIAECAGRGEPAWDYLANRGISEDLCRAFRIGYDPAFRFSVNLTAPACVIPLDNDNWVARNMLRGAGKADRYRYNDGCDCSYFNSSALACDVPCVITEGAVDALAVMTAGGSAMGLGGSGGFSSIAGDLGRILESGKLSSKRVAFLLDADEAGRKAQEDILLKLPAELHAIGLGYPVGLGYADGLEAKDPADLLLLAPDSLKKLVTGIRSFREEMEEKLLADGLGNRLSAFSLFLQEDRSTPIPTGFPELDLFFGGGLPTRGMGGIVAVPGLGKSELCVQIMDTLAGHGQDVIYFALEMTREELMARSIIRRMAQLWVDDREDADRNEFFGLGTVKPPRMDQLLHGTAFREMDDYSRDAFQRALKAYQSSAGSHIWIYEGLEVDGYKDVISKVRHHMDLTGRIPVVIIDYLQLLCRADKGQTDKQAVDECVRSLKAESGNAEHGFPCIVVSSMSKAKYDDPVDLGAFKESGSIEYTLSWAIGLQMHREKTITFRTNKDGKTYPIEGEEVASDMDVRDIDLKVMKNRNGRTGIIRMTYVPCIHTFTGSGEWLRIGQDTESYAQLAGRVRALRAEAEERREAKNQEMTLEEQEAEERKQVADEYMTQVCRVWASLSADADAPKTDSEGRPAVSKEEFGRMLSLTDEGPRGIAIALLQDQGLITEDGDTLIIGERYADRAWDCLRTAMKLRQEALEQAVWKKERRYDQIFGRLSLIYAKQEDDIRRLEQELASRAGKPLPKDKAKQEKINRYNRRFLAPAEERLLGVFPLAVTEEGAPLDEEELRTAREARARIAIPDGIRYMTVTRQGYKDEGQERNRDKAKDFQIDSRTGWVKGIPLADITLLEEVDGWHKAREAEAGTEEAEAGTEEAEAGTEEPGADDAPVQQELDLSEPEEAAEVVAGSEQK